MSLVPKDAQIIGDAQLDGRRVNALESLEQTDTARVNDAHLGTDADSIVRFLLTSGSTGQPKAVITTNRMCCSNAAMLRQSMPFLASEPPVLLDWLPWNHTFGGSHNIGLVLANGGSLYIDDGRPTPAGMAETLRNLREISPTVYFNVPKGFEMLAPHLRDDAQLRKTFYRRLRAYFFAGASLAQHTWDELDAASTQELGLQGADAVGSRRDGDWTVSHIHYTCDGPQRCDRAAGRRKSRQARASRREAGDPCAQSLRDAQGIGVNPS